MAPTPNEIAKWTKDYYALLGVRSTATSAEITRAYRKLAVNLHPDKNKAPNATEKFQALGEAYDVLKNSGTRERYTAVWQLMKSKPKLGSKCEPMPACKPSASRTSVFTAPEDDYMHSLDREYYHGQWTNMADVHLERHALSYGAQNYFEDLIAKERRQWIQVRSLCFQYWEWHAAGVYPRLVAIPGEARRQVLKHRNAQSVLWSSIQSYKAYDKAYAPESKHATPGAERAANDAGHSQTASSEERRQQAHQSTEAMRSAKKIFDDSDLRRRATQEHLERSANQRNQIRVQVQAQMAALASQWSPAAEYNAQYSRWHMLPGLQMCDMCGRLEQNRIRQCDGSRSKVCSRCQPELRSYNSQQTQQRQQPQYQHDRQQTAESPCALFGHLFPGATITRGEVCYGCRSLSPRERRFFFCSLCNHFFCSDCHDSLTRT